MFSFTTPCIGAVGTELLSDAVSFLVGVCDFLLKVAGGGPASTRILATMVCIHDENHSMGNLVESTTCSSASPASAMTRTTAMSQVEKQMGITVIAVYGGPGRVKSTVLRSFTKAIEEVSPNFRFSPSTREAIIYQLKQSLTPRTTNEVVVCCHRSWTCIYRGSPVAPPDSDAFLRSLVEGNRRDGSESAAELATCAAVDAIMGADSLIPPRSSQASEVAERKAKRQRLLLCQSSASDAAAGQPNASSQYKPPVTTAPTHSASPLESALTKLDAVLSMEVNDSSRVAREVVSLFGQLSEDLAKTKAYLQYYQDKEKLEAQVSEHPLVLSTTLNNTAHPLGR